MKFNTKNTFWLFLLAVCTTMSVAQPSVELEPDVFQLQEFSTMVLNEPSPFAVELKVKELPKINPKELACLSRNIYFEAGDQPFLGKIGVGVVTMNRAKSEKFPDSICSVVNQRTKNPDGRNICQFSWVCSGARSINTQSVNWQSSLEAAELLLSGGYRIYHSLFDGAMFFHASRLLTTRSKNNYVVRVGEHIFYR